MRISTGTIGSGICVLLATFLAIWFLPKSSIFPATAYGPIIHEETSSYSTIRVRGADNKRHLLFVAGNGREGLQSSIDLDNPGQLQVPYTRALFASFLFRHPQEKVLIVGLGGGGMVRFIDHQLPGTKVEVVEIDPVVVSLADKYFGTGQTPRVTIHTEDAFLFFRRNTSQFDAIYMDAFLKPSVDRKADSETARLKTVSFLKTIKAQLVPGGVLACNLITHRKETRADLVALSRSLSPGKNHEGTGDRKSCCICNRTRCGNIAAGSKKNWRNAREIAPCRHPVFGLCYEIEITRSMTGLLENTSIPNSDFPLIQHPLKDCETEYLAGPVPRTT